jgi:hypothetical protein
MDFKHNYSTFVIHERHINNIKLILEVEKNVSYIIEIKDKIMTFGTMAIAALMLFFAAGPIIDN